MIYLLRAGTLGRLPFLNLTYGLSPKDLRFDVSDDGE